MKKKILIVGGWCLVLGAWGAGAGVPLRWTVETSRAQPAAFEAYQGETLDFEATLQSYGRPLELGLEALSEVRLYWQTNGMGSAWWSKPATAGSATGEPVASGGGGATNVFRATWTPDCDVGARAYTCFVGITGTVYHAAFQLRLRPSPGAVPNALPLPQRVIDFANTVVINAPWPTDATIDASIRRVIHEDGITAEVNPAEIRGIVTDTVDRAYVEGLGISAGLTTNDVEGIVAEGVRDKRDKGDRRVYGEDGVKWFKADGTAIVLYHVFHDNGEIYWQNKADWVEGTPGDDYVYAGSGATGEETTLTLYRGMSGPPLGTFTRDTLALTSELGGYAPLASLASLSSDVAAASDAANEANAWSAATYAFMTGGRTNCWWSGTNYVFGSAAATRHRFAWEDGMDAATVPCSMALYEIRDGARECVWDQRDWTAWYWSFKAGQTETNVAAQVAAALVSVTNDANYAWARRYASDGARNPDPSTTFIDTPAVAISPGMRWETVATVAGAAYWTVVGSGAVIGGSGTNATLTIRDFEGNEIMTVTKGEHRLAWLESGEFVGQMTDAQGRVCFDMLADAQPVGHFSTTLEADDFVAETDGGCPADCEWESLGGGRWRVHFLLKPGIQATACFAKFLVEVEGQTVIRYNAGQEIRGGLIYNGVRIAPDVSGSPAVGTVIQWKVVQ